MNVDDIVIGNKKPKTFDELLEEEMAKGAGGGITTEGKPKPPVRSNVGKEFLKRKSTQVSVPIQKKSEKSYRYYTDNFEKEVKTPVDRSSPAASKQVLHTLPPPAAKRSTIKQESN
jgi:hypothetical protein